jgi:hypothetical protein
MSNVKPRTPQGVLPFGKFRGMWLDQVLADKEMTSDFCRVMCNIAGFMRKNNLRPKPGNQTLADKSFVSEKTVRRALDKARARGHLDIQEESGRSPRILIPLLKDDAESGLKVHTEESSESGLKVHTETSDETFETGHKVHTETGQEISESGLESGLQCGQSFRGSPVESKGRIPLSQDTQESQSIFTYQEDITDSDSVSKRERPRTLDAAHGQWGHILLEFGIPYNALNGKQQPCPACGGTDRFRYTDRHGDGDYFCSHCKAGKGISLVAKVNGWSYVEAAKRIDHLIGNDGTRSMSVTLEQTF